MPRGRLRFIHYRAQISRNVRTPLWLLLASAAVLLLIACANVANLTLARSAERKREFAIRARCSAAEARDCSVSSVTESLALGFLGGAAGFLLGHFTTQAILAMGSSFIPRAADVQLDPWVMLFALFVSCLTAVLFGILPAVQASRIDLNDALKSVRTWKHLGKKARASSAGNHRSESVVSVADSD